MDEYNNFRQILTLPLIKGEMALISQETQTTVGSAGGATALPATPTGYLKIIIDATEYVIPYYAQS